MPQFIDKYNHFMNGVDVADQLRSYYTTQRIHTKSWKPLWHFLLDTTIVNCYKIAKSSPKRPWGEPSSHHSHKDFRLELVEELFMHSKRLTPEPKLAKHLKQSVAQTNKPNHVELIRMDGDSKTCDVYMAKKSLGLIILVLRRLWAT